MKNLTDHFTHEELITLLNVAFLALKDGEFFDFCANEMDLSDKEMIELRDKNTDFLENQ